MLLKIKVKKWLRKNVSPIILESLYLFIKHDNKFSFLCLLCVMKVNSYTKALPEDFFLMNNYVYKIRTKENLEKKLNDNSCYLRFFKNEIDRIRNAVIHYLLECRITKLSKTDYIMASQQFMYNFGLDKANNDTIIKDYKVLSGIVLSKFNKFDASHTKKKVTKKKKSILYFCDYVYMYGYNPIEYIKYHDYSNYDVFLFSNQPVNKEFLKSDFLFLDDFKCLAEMNFDYVFDCNGFMMPEKSLYAIGRRIGKIQISAYNDLLPINCPHIDKILSYEHLVGNLDKKHFLVLKDECIINTCPKAKTDINFKLPYIKNEFITFGSFSGISKISTSSIELWAKILKKIQDARLLLINQCYKHEYARRIIIDRFAMFGIERSKITFKDASGYPNYLNEIKNIDVLLGTYPLAGGRVLTQTLAEGYFSVTLEKADNTFSRLSGMFANALGLQEFNTQDPDYYVDKCIELAKEPSRIKEVQIMTRAKIAEFNRDHRDYYASCIERALMAL